MIESFKITSINGGVDVTFTHTEDCACGVPNPHEVNISGDLVPYKDADELKRYIEDHARAFNEGKAAAATKDSSAVAELINQPITIE